MKRRPFLASAAAASVGVTFGRAAETPKRKLGWALVGLGNLSRGQLGPALRATEHARLAAIVTGTPEKAERWKQEYGVPDTHVYNYETYDRIADNPDVDVIYIVLPNGMHEEYTIRGLKAGKHVFCEKPMANTAEECRRMIAASREAGRKLGVGYRCQFEPHHREAIRLARDEVFGRLRHIEAGFGFGIGDPNQWRLDKELAGGGPLMDVGIYALQACRYLTGEEPVEVTAQTVKTNPEKFDEVEETLVWTMRFPSGVTTTCETTYAYNGINHFTAYCQDGRFGIEPAYGYGGIEGSTSRDDVSLDFGQTNHFAAEIDAFSKAILNGEDFEPSGVEGLRDLLAIEAIYRAAKEGRTVRVGEV